MQREGPLEAPSSLESADAAAYRRWAVIHDRAARVYEESANLREYYARRCAFEDLKVEAEVLADRARESAERSRAWGDELRAAAGAER